MTSDIEQLPEFIFGMQDETRFAPPQGLESPQEVDEELQKDLGKIPEKLAFKIGDVADITGVKPYVLRFWESEFEALKPQKSKHNQRVYTRREIETVLMIKKLLYRDRFSIEGARSALKKLRKETKTVKAMMGTQERLEEIRTKLEDLILDIQRLRNRYSSERANT